MYEKRPSGSTSSFQAAFEVFADEVVTLNETEGGEIIDLTRLRKIFTDIYFRVNSDEEPSAAVVGSKTLRCALKSEFPQLSFMRVTNLRWSELVYFQENKSALHLLTSSGTESDSSSGETPARSGKEKYRTVHSREEVRQPFHSATGLKTKLEQSPKLNAAWPPLAACCRSNM